MHGFVSSFTCCFAVVFRFSELIMLRGDNYCVDAYRVIISVILNSYLCFWIRSQVSHMYSVFTYFGKFLKQYMRQLNWQWHIIVHLFTCITEHNALIAGTMFFITLAFHPLKYVIRLFVDCGNYTTGICIKPIRCLGITNLTDCLSNNVLDVNITIGSYFTTANYQPCCCKRFTGYFWSFLMTQKFVQQRIADLVRHFVRMSFTYWFWSE